MSWREKLSLLDCVSRSISRSIYHPRPSLAINRTPHLPLSEATLQWPRMQPSATIAMHHAADTINKRDIWLAICDPVAVPTHSLKASCMHSYRLLFALALDNTIQYWHFFRFFRFFSCSRCDLFLMSWWTLRKCSEMLFEILDEKIGVLSRG